ncbi:MAG TPA: hypothetical protein VFF06_02740 [Polyangia bacterium]|nr:hypothetical protein [Polyangia bacterium]
MTLVRSILIALAVLLPASWTVARAEGEPAKTEKKADKKAEKKADKKEEKKEEKK